MAKRIRNPKWSREELILALNFYFQVKERFPSGASDARVQELSRRLNLLAKPDGVGDISKFRNPSGALMKLMNFRRFDSDFTAQGKSGLKNGGKLEEVIWNEFIGRPDLLREAVNKIYQQGDDSLFMEPEKENRTWIFQANPDTFDINSYLESRLAERAPIRWVVRQKPTAIQVGDHVYIWRSAGKKRGESGVIASGIVLTEPKNMADDSGGLWSDGEPAEELRVVIELHDVRLSAEEGMLLAQDLSVDSTLEQLRIFRMRAETNYMLSAEHGSKLMLLWSRDGGQLEQEAFSGGFSEGEKKERIHMRRERNRKLVELAKSQFIGKHGRLFCEACGFNAHLSYGIDPDKLIEAHHKVAVSELEAGSYTRVEDLIMLCPNCHRVVHHRRPWLSVDELKALIRKN